MYQQMTVQEIYMWCDLGESVVSQTCDFSVFSLIEVVIWRGTFWWESHLNRSSGSKVMSNWWIFRTIENNRNSFLFLTISRNQCCRLPTDPPRSQHICMLCVLKVTWLFNKIKVECFYRILSSHLELLSQKGKTCQ